MSTPMPQSLPSTPSELTASKALPAPTSSWLREPLLHFVLLGAVVFAADHVLVGRTSDANTIVVGADVDAETRKLFSEARGRAPQDAEMTELRNRWLDNEVLYREGLAMRVDKGDPAIRDRVIFKALMSIESNLRLPAVDDKQLRAWFDAHHAKYDQPARYDFLEAVLPGDATEAQIRTMADTLNAGAPGEVETRAGLRVFKGRPLSNITQSYGADFAKALEASTPGQWRAMATKDGLRVMQLQAITPPQSADFESLQAAVKQDWVDETMAQMRTDAVRALSKKYVIKVEEPAK